MRKPRTPEEIGEKAAEFDNWNKRAEELFHELDGLVDSLHEPFTGPDPLAIRYREIRDISSGITEFCFGTAETLRAIAQEVEALGAVPQLHE